MTGSIRSSRSYISRSTSSSSSDSSSSRQRPFRLASPSPQRGSPQSIPLLLTKLQGPSEVGYRLYGDLASTRPPVLFFHGSPCSSFQARKLDVTAQQLGLLIVAIDRPGVGLSNHDPSRKITGFTPYCKAVLKHLRIRRFYMMSMSGGTPYLLASLRYYSARVLGVAIVAGVPPWHLAKPNLDNAAQYKLLAINTLPTALATTTIQGARWIIDNTANSGYGKKLLHQSLQRWTQDIVASDPLAHPAGCLLDIKLMQAEWGFEPSSVKHKGIQMWYSDDDTTIPAKVGLDLAKQLQEPVFKRVKGVGHREILPKYAEQILLSLTAF